MADPWGSGFVTPVHAKITVFDCRTGPDLVSIWCSDAGGAAAVSRRPTFSLLTRTTCTTCRNFCRFGGMQRPVR
eukprot:s2_g80.t1